MSGTDWDQVDLAQYIADAYNKVGYPITIRGDDVLVALPEVNAAILQAMARREREHADCEGCPRCVMRIYHGGTTDPRQGRPLLNRLAWVWKRRTS